MRLPDKKIPSLFRVEKDRKGFDLPTRRFALLVVCLLAVLLGGSLPTVQAGPTSNLPELTAPATPPANDKQFRYVEATGHSLIAPVLRFYSRTGGEERHGKPLSELIWTKGHYLQYFERSVLQFSPEYNGTGEEVSLLPLGRIVASDNKVNLSPVTPFLGTPANWYFPETGHTLSGDFLTFWRNQGELDTLGLPISEDLTEDGPDNTRLTVQYFENGRLQRPTDNDKADVSISPLGTIRARQQLKPEQLASVPRERFNAPRAVRIPSLMFHYARIVEERADPLGYALSVTPNNYLKFLDWVKENGYNTVTIGQINDYLRYGILLPNKPVNFRWDDGHDNNWFVYQEMKKRGMTATFFVISQRLELTPAQWKQIDDDGFEVAAHTRTHPDLRGVRDLAGEIGGSKHDMELILGHPVRTFAYPYGKYNNTIRQVARDSGFEIAVSTNGGYYWNSDITLEEPVVSVTGYDDVYSFAGKIKNASYAPASNSTDNPAPKTAVPAKTPVTQKPGPTAVSKPTQKPKS